MTKFIQAFAKNESGASAAEYALILAIIGAGIVAASIALGTSISSAMTRTAVLVDNVNS